MKHLITVLLIMAVLFTIGGCAKKESKTIAVATFVDHVILDSIRDSFLSELGNLGYTKENGWSIVVKSANGQTKEAVQIADEFMNMDPTVLVSISTPSTKPIFDRNQGRYPHVYSFVSFPSSIGIEPDSKNTTGLSDGVDFAGIFDLMTQLTGELKTVGMLYSDEPNAIISKDNMYELCEAHGVKFIGMNVVNENDIRTMAQEMTARDIDVFFIGADSKVVNQVKAIIEVMNDRKIPTFATEEGSVELGALASLSVNYQKFGTATAEVVDQVIKQGNADIEQISYLGSDLILNVDTAKKIGVEVPQDMLEKASSVFSSQSE